MTEAKFTKGPWGKVRLDGYCEGGSVWAFFDKDRDCIFDVCCCEGGIKDADLALILAAPDMYEALEEVIKIYNFKEMVRTDKTINSPRDDPDRGKIFFTYNDLSKAREALRKARGEAE